MALVMGISSAQASLLNVHEDFIDSSGVYAILNSPPFISFAEGVGAIIYRNELSICISQRVPEAIFFRGNMIMTTMIKITKRLRAL